MNQKGMMNIFWVLSLFSKLIYLFLWYTKVRILPASGAMEQEMILLIVFGAVALVCFLVALFLSRQYEDTSRIVEKLLLSRISPESPGTKDFIILLYSLSFLETLSVLGLALSFISVDKTVFLYFLGAHVLGWILVKPQLKKL